MSSHGYTSSSSSSYPEDKTGKSVISGDSNGKSDGYIDQSDSSVDDILPSLRLSANELPKSSALDSSFFEFGKPKSLSTNSSPIKSSLKQEVVKAPLSAYNLSNNKVTDEVKKSVRFHGWEVAKDQKEKVSRHRRKRGSFFHRSPQKKRVSAPLRDTTPPQVNAGSRVQSSDYSCTPDTTDFTQLDVPSLSEKQLKYLLPGMLGSIKQFDENDGVTDKRNPHIKKAKNKQYNELSDLFRQDDEMAPESAHSGLSVFSQVGPQSSNLTSTKSDIKHSAATQDVDMITEDKRTKPTTPSQKVKTTYPDADETDMSLARRFNDLSLVSPEESLRAKGFCLKLSNNQYRPSSNGSADISYDQIDILDQVPPELPNMTADSISPDPNVSHATIPLFDNLSNNEDSIAKNQLKDSILELSKSLDEVNMSEQQILSLDSHGMVQVLNTLCAEISRKISHYKIQNIKNSKVVKDDEILIAELQSKEHALKLQLHKLELQTENEHDEITILEKKVSEQTKTITYVRGTNSSLEDKVRSQDLELKHLRDLLEIKDLELERVTNLTERYRSELLLDSDKSKLDKLSSVSVDALLKAMLTNGLNFKENSIAVHTEADKYKLELTQLQLNNEHLEELLQKANHNAMTTDQVLLQTKDDLRKRIEQTDWYETELKETKKELETTYSNLSKETENNKILSSRVKNMEEVINEQLEALKSAHEHMEIQKADLNELGDLKSRLPNIILEKDQCLQELHETSLKLDEVNAQLENTRKQCQRTHQQKDDEINRLKSLNSALDSKHETVFNDLSETRAKLSDSCYTIKELERKVKNLSSSLATLQQSNRTLRSDGLKNGSIKTQYKRVLVELLTNILREFEGIIDPVSLASAKESLKLVEDDNDDTEKELININDSTFFIQEVITLVLKDYWDLHTKLANNQKNMLSASSLNTLQRINDSQNSKIKKLELKLQYYESVFKKINAPGVSNSEALSEDQESVSSVATTSERRKEGRRLQAKLRTSQNIDY